MSLSHASNAVTSSIGSKVSSLNSYPSNNGAVDALIVKTCTGRDTDSIDRRFCFDLVVEVLFSFFFNVNFLFSFAFRQYQTVIKNFFLYVYLLFLGLFFKNLSHKSGLHLAYTLGVGCLLKFLRRA